MKAPAAPGRPAARRWTWWLFVALEVVAVLAVPVVAVVGARALLDTRAGTFVAGPGVGDPGFQALVDPTPVQAVVERRDGELTGITILTRPGADDPGGAAVLVPAQLEVEGRTLAAWGADGDAAAVGALARALRLGLGEPVALDAEAWSDLLGDRSVEVANPDPVIVDGRVRFAQGRVELAGADVADWLGEPGGQERSALLFRRQLWWEALLDADLPAPGAGSPPPAAAIASIGDGPHAVELLPVDPGAEAVALDADAAEALVVDVVPFPAGAQPGDRLRARVLDRTGSADLDAIAREVARAGGEVVAIGNAGEFDGGPTEVVITDPALDEAARRLTERMGTGTVELSPAGDDSIEVTVLAGPDLVGRVAG